MPGVVPSRLPAAASALPVADVRTGVHGNGDGPSDKGGSDSDDEVRTVDISPETNCTPPRLARRLQELAGLSSKDAWTDSKGLGPTLTPLQALVGSSFRLPPS